MTLPENLLSISDAYCIARGVSVATVSGIIFKNSRTLPRIRNGGGITVRNYERAVNWYRDNWPDGHPMPAQLLERPAQEAVG